jgi:hypothetical protein
MSHHLFLPISLGSISALALPAPGAGAILDDRTAHGTDD